MMTTRPLNLQLFAGEKTEKATPRRREEARKKGQVAKSHELNTVLVVTLTLVTLKMWIPVMVADFQQFFTHLFTGSFADLTAEGAFLLILDIILLLAKMVTPLLLVAMTVGFAANVVQVGFYYTTEPLKPDLNRINPVSGFQRLFSKRALAELVKSLCKTLLVGYIAFSFLWKQMPALAVLMDVPLTSALATVGNVTFSAAWRMMGLLFILAIADYSYQHYEYEQSLKMSKQEIKDEYKTIEGDPQLKAKIKERQRQLATRRMMQEVPRATVVITNPTHLAVALKYEDKMNAPVLVAKGQDFLAGRIKEVATANGVPIVENKPLARLLYQRVEINMSIPADLYQAVAEVIAYVYRLKKRI